MLSWETWKQNNKDNIAHVANFEEKFIDSVLSKIPEIDPDDVISQYHFTDFKGKNRYIDFMIINSNKGYELPIELDGYSKLELERDYSRFNDFLERQNALTSKFGILLRYTNKKMLQESPAIVKEIRDVLNKQNKRLSTELINKQHIASTIQDYEGIIENLQEQITQQNINSNKVVESSVHESIKQIQQQLNQLAAQSKVSEKTAPLTNEMPQSKEVFTIKRIIIGGSITLIGILIVSLAFKAYAPSTNNHKIQNLSNQNIQNQSGSVSNRNMPMQSNLAANENQLNDQAKTSVKQNKAIQATNTQVDATESKKKIVGVSADLAKKYMGMSKTVCGRVVEVKHFSSGIYLNFNKAYPNQPFTAVVWEENLSHLGDINRYLDTQLCVNGEISSYKGSAQMKIQSTQQILQF